jgi:hypothetical protein
MTQQASTPARSLHKLGLGINLGGTLRAHRPEPDRGTHQRQTRARART